MEQCGLDCEINTATTRRWAKCPRFLVIRGRFAGSREVCLAVKISQSNDDWIFEAVAMVRIGVVLRTSCRILQASEYGSINGW